MNNRASNNYLLFTFIAVAIFMLAISIVINPLDFSTAENSSVVIDLTQDSKFDAYHDSFSYTSGNSLYVVCDNTIISCNNAFSGTCLDIAMNESEIVLLSKEGQKTTLTYFTYDSATLTKTSQNYTDSEQSVTSLFGSSSGDIYVTISYSTELYVKKFEQNLSLGEMTPGLTLKDNCIFTDFTFVSTPTVRIYGIMNGIVYHSTTSYTIDATTGLTATAGMSDASSISCLIGNTLYINSASGIYSLDVVSDTLTKACDSPNASGKIVAVTIDDTPFVFVLGNNSIIQYSVNGTSLEYLNKFDNSEYVHPTNMDIVKVAQVNSNANVYSSPKNLQVTATLSNSEYILILCEKKDDENGDYFYIVTSTNQLGYIKSDIPFSYIPANNNTDQLEIGLYAQGLHTSTPVYKYPYSSSAVLKNIGIEEQLIVIDNVAQFDNQQVWKYYKVSYVENGEIITGYVKTTDVSPYTSLRAPTILKTVKVSTATIGEPVSIYALPNQESTEVAILTDGAELNLAEEFNKDSEWTKIVYNGSYAYVLTANVQQTSLTALQITIIIISIIVVATTITVLILYKRKKFGF